MKKATLILEDKGHFEGYAFGAANSAAGEVVFATGMVGYEQSLTDPSYAGQILVFTYPLIGNWGVPKKEYWESEKIQVQGVIISDLTTNPNHHLMQKTLDSWLKEEKIPGIFGIDTRKLTQKLREKGVMLGKIIVDNKDINFWDPNSENLVAKVSVDKVRIHHPANSTLSTHHSSLKIGLLNCGAKKNILRSLLARGFSVYEVPWNFDPFKNKQSFSASKQSFSASKQSFSASKQSFSASKQSLRSSSFDELRAAGLNLPIDGLVISNGPGDPKMAKESIEIIKKALNKKIPTFGICLGNQLLALAAGGDTYKLKFGHRAQNQPTIEVGTKRCYITTQNHGFTVNEKKLPKGFRRWFYNANDNTNEGLIHEKLPFFSVQFHPEATPGPYDTEFLFDLFAEQFR